MERQLTRDHRLALLVELETTEKNLAELQSELKSLCSEIIPEGDLEKEARLEVSICIAQSKLRVIKDCLLENLIEY